ncbi:MAG: 30S ribosomal protein S24e [Acidilobus sp.]
MQAPKRIELGDGTYLEVIVERRNELLSRVEVQAIAHHELKSTPSRAMVRDALAKAYNKPVEAIYVKAIKTNYGVGISTVHAHVYDSHEAAMKVEPAYILARHGEEERKQSKQKQG